MHNISEFVRDSTKKPEGNYILLHLIAAQVVAKAAYEGVRFHDIDQIKAAVREVAGYPMHNRITVSVSRPKNAVEDEAARRVAQLVGVSVE